MPPRCRKSDTAGPAMPPPMMMARDVCVMRPKVRRVYHLYQSSFMMRTIMDVNLSAMALVVRRDHPRVRRRMTRELFNGLPHIDVHVALGRPGPGHRVAQRQWEQARGAPADRADRPALHDAAMAAAQTDCVAAMPERIADLCIGILPLKRVARRSRCRA